MPDRSNLGQRLAPVGGALAALLLIITGWTLWNRPASDGPTADRSSSGALADLPTAASAPASPGSPRRIVVPALSVDAPVDPILATDRTLTPPADPQRIGWWADGARPGDRRGTALLTGHTVSTGGGALDDLEDLVAGDRLEVSSSRGSIDYTVASVEIISTSEVAARHRELFDQGGAPRLVLVTCEDWDGEAYQSSVVVTASPTSAG